jgi:stearoyl-CoA desaturase (delta-9 desaturase)
MATVLETPRKKRTGSNPRKAQSSGEGKRSLGGHPTKVERVHWNRVNWASVIWLAVVHAGACVAPFFFSWQAVLLTLVLHWVTGGLGICLGYHRMLTHTGMKTYGWVRYVFASLGSLAGEGSPLDWVADHRKHHQLSDQPGDPHSPHDGGFWSHMLWIGFATYEAKLQAHHEKYIPDLLRDRGMRVMHYMFLPLNFALGFILLGVGYAMGGWAMAASLVTWGMFVRLVFVLHSTWLVNSASHMFGYRNYETTDDSRNNWWVALLTYGEGWHNNHHAFPRLARHGHKWWEIDMTYMAIRVLKAVGLVWDVVDLDKGKRGAAIKEA